MNRSGLQFQFFIIALGWVCITATKEDIARANSDFGFDLYRKISEVTEGENIFLSPFSVSSALALLYYGSRGQCAAEMADTMGYQNEESSHQSYKELNDVIFADSPGNTVLELANRLFGQEGIDFEESYKTGLEKYYNSPLEEVDFAGNPEEARELVNNWVERQTNNKIENLFPEGTISANTILVLANAIYFKGIWQHQFKKENTRSGTFTLEDGTTVNTDYMHHPKSSMRVNFNDENLGAKILELPYEGNKTAFYIIMPNRPDTSIDDLEDSLTYDSLQAAVNDLNSPFSPFKIDLPKFKISWKMSLLGLLYDMGMKCPFGPGADFTGIIEDGGLFADEIIHQAYVDVNEEGTEAAAATGIVMSRGMPRTFSANSPFIFLIRDQDSGSVLFMGRVTNPGTTGGEGPQELRFSRYRRSELSAESPDSNYQVTAGSATSCHYFDLVVLLLCAFFTKGMDY